MGAILLLIMLGVALVLVICFFAVNRWSSRSRDREKNSDLRNSRQMGQQANTDTRGTGIN
jgi:hypothetical protein